jgi:hypothetical protein
MVILNKNLKFSYHYKLDLKMNSLVASSIEYLQKCKFKDEFIGSKFHRISSKMQGYTVVKLQQTLLFSLTKDSLWDNFWVESSF